MGDVACGLQHAIALDKHGRVFTWGSNACGQLGTMSLSKTRRPPPHAWRSVNNNSDQQGSTSTSSYLEQQYDKPQPLHCVSRVKISKIAAGHSHSILLT